MNILIAWVAVLSLLTVTLLLAVFALARQIGVLFERVTPVGAMVNNSGPKIGEKSPEFSLTSLTGGVEQLGSASSRDTLVFFLSPTCPICKTLVPVLRAMRVAEQQSLRIVLASDGDVTRHRNFVEHNALGDFPYVVSEQLGVTYRVAKLPFAVLLDREGVVRAKGLVNSREQIESLFESVETGYASVQDYLARAS